MKKLFYIFASAIVALGAVACQNDIDETIENNQDKGFSITANIDDLTRVELSDKDADNNRKLTWTDGDILEAEMLNEEGKVEDIRHFSYSGNNTFTCYDDDAKAWVENQLASHGFINFYYKRSAGLGEYNEVDKYQFMLMGALIVDGDAITMQATQTIFHFTTGADDVTLKYLASSATPEEFTVKANGEYYMGVYVGQNITLEAYVGDEKIKEKTNCTFETGKIYNLGHLEKEIRHKVYLYNNNKDWAKVNLYSWDDAGTNFTGTWPGTQLTETAPVGANEFFVYTMPAAATGKKISFIANNGTAQTGDFVMPTALNSDIYLLLNSNTLSIIENPEEFTPAAPEAHKLYIYNKVNWSKLNIYSWNDAGTLTGAWPGTAITTTEMVGEVKYYVYTMPAAVTGTTFNIIINNGSAQTGDFALPSAFNSDVYLLLDGNLSVIEDPAKPEGDVQDQPTVGQNSAWSVSGSFNSWGDAVMVTTEDQNVFVAKGIKLSAYAAFKVRKDKAWTEGYGGGIVYMNNNSYIKVYNGGSDINNTAAGTYDIYFDYNNKYVYLMTAGTDYKTAVLQEKEGPQPDTSNISWGLCGAHNSWGNNDTKLVWDGTLGLYVAKNAKLTGEFKVRADNSWTTNFGSGGTVTVDKAAATTLYNNGGNSKPSKTGTFDVYFWYDKTNLKNPGKIWIKTVGSAAPTL